mgnify:FL=1
MGIYRKEYIKKEDVVLWELHEIRNKLYKELKDKSNLSKFYSYEKDIHNYSKIDFCEIVEKAIKTINDSKAKKIVMSRTLKVPLDNDFDIINFFEKLCEKYPKAFISIVSIPNLGTWIGATPESLISIKNNEFISTMAVAGTQNYNPKISDYYWDEKDTHEHDYVVDYIKDTFEYFNIDYIKENKDNLFIGNIVHLITRFNGKIDKNTSIIELIYKLHPTPAVCGVEKNFAQDFIIKTEKHKRAYYSGFLGYLNLNNSSKLYVNLRCMELIKKYSVLYLGCGIVSESIPEKEWEETEKKSEILLSVLKTKFYSK